MSTQSKLDELLKLGGVDLPAGSRVDISGQEPVVPGPFRLGEAAAVALAAQGAAIAAIWQQRAKRSQQVAVDIVEAALSLKSVLYLRQRGYSVPYPDPEYPTTNTYKTKDGRYIMTHGGYPALRDRLLALLRCANDQTQIEAAIAQHDSAELEEAIAAANACGTIARTSQEWLAHPQGQALAATPLLDIKRVGDSPTEPPGPGPRPLSGLRVLDMTHVLAGPTCGRVLAEQGADVLRISAPQGPVITGFIMDTGHGKLSTLLNLKERDDADRFRALLSEADVLLYSYRPGALDRLGFSDAEIYRIRPGIVFASVSCYGEVGPWSKRAGWEQLAQMATGMGIAQQTEPGKPQLSVVYPNDYVTGYLTAYAVLAALLDRGHKGGSYRVKASLCRTAMWLQSFEPAPTTPACPSADALARVAKRLELNGHTAWGPISYLGPITRFTETHPHWQRPTTPLAHDPVLWPAGPRFSGKSPETIEEATLYAREIVQI